MENEDYVTVPEAALALGVTGGAVHIAITEGRLPHVVKYGRKLISRADLDAYKQRTRPEGEKPRGRPQGSRGKRPASLEGQESER